LRFLEHGKAFIDAAWYAVLLVRIRKLLLS
jgi:hypothetical protein